MKKLSAMVMAGVMALGMVGCGSTAAEAPAESTAPAAESTAAETTESTVEAQTEATGAQTEAGRQFVVGFDAEFPPYGYKDDSGEYVGFDLDLAQEVCNRLGWSTGKTAHRLGCEGYGAGFRRDRLYLEWLYHERQRRSVHLQCTLCG